MQNAQPNQTHSGALRLRSLSIAGVTILLAVAACTDDPIVYPNRNLRAPSAGATSEGGAAGEAGAAEIATGGKPHGGSGGSNAGGGGGLLGEAGTVGEDAGAPPTGPVCGDGKIEPPEECEDGNTVSGDGCSADCKSSCEKCEKNVCPLFDVVGEYPKSAYDTCYAPTVKIQTGPAVGVPRSEVCGEVADCIREENCAQTTKGGQLKALRCWCDQDWDDPKRSPYSQCIISPDPNNPMDPSKFIPGKCANLFQDASEHDGLSFIPSRQTGVVDFALGMALRLVQVCDTRVCTEECVPNYFGAGGIATVAADIVAAPNAAGESPLGDLLADSQRAVANTDFAFVSSNFISADDPVDILVAPTANRDADASGRVLWSEALAVGYGFRSKDATSGLSLNAAQALGALYKVTLTGQQVYDALTQQLGASPSRKLLFVSGLTYSYTFDASTPSASIVNEVHRASDDSPILMSATYTVALSSFLTGSDGPVPALKQGAKPTTVQAVQLSELLGEYLKQLPQPVSPPELNRITCLNCPPP